jgi:hypothetical protein
VIKGLSAGTGISLAASASAITITNSTTLATSGGSISLINDDTLPSFAIKGLTPGTGISLTDNTTGVTITNGGVTSLTAATGLSVTSSTGSITISQATNIGFFAVWLANASSADPLTGQWSVSTTAARTWNLPAGSFSTSTVPGTGGIFTVPAAGQYYCSFNVSTDSDAITVYMTVNSVSVLAVSDNTDNSHGCAGGSAILSLSAADQVALGAGGAGGDGIFAQSRGAGNLYATWFSIVKIK